jgi:hypothetical protein
MSIATPETLATELLGRLRGRITDVHPAYPETIHLELTDTLGGAWYFATLDASYSPSDPEALRGKTIVDVTQELPSGGLTMSFSDGTCFRLSVEPPDADDDPANWRLYTPEGLALSWGPGAVWDIARANAPS